MGNKNDEWKVVFSDEDSADLMRHLDMVGVRTAE
jgi:hypothetical protein